MAFLKVKEMIKGVSETIVNAANEDRRRMIHAAKVGVAMAAVSLLYFFDVFQDGSKAGSGLSIYAMWAVYTVTVVFEFSIGETIGKGVNRTLATVVGGALGVAAHGATGFLGKTVEFILLAFITFLIGNRSTQSG